MAKHLEVMNLREVEIGKIIEHLSGKTDAFENPKMVLIGGYALRAFTSFSQKNLRFFHKTPKTLHKRIAWYQIGTTGTKKWSLSLSKYQP